MNTEQKAQRYLNGYDTDENGDTIHPERIITALLAERQALLDASKLCIPIVKEKAPYNGLVAIAYYALDEAIQLCEEQNNE